MQAQVVVVGGGPVGMLVAAELASYGVDTVLFEPQTRVSDRPKATTLHARAVQCLARRGHLPEPGVRPEGAAGPAPFHFGGLSGLLIAAPRTEPQPILKCPQAELERHFEGRARAAGTRIVRGTRVTEVFQDPEGALVTAHGPQGPVSCSAEYVVGADGARSTVREGAGIASDVRPATVASLMGTVTLADPDALPQGWLRTERGWIVSKRDPEGRTHIRTLDCAAAHGDRHREPTLEELRGEVSRIAGHEVAMADPRWLSRFGDATKLARAFRAGRVFLAGDAAHVHFPIGGQGLSTGVLDALNLGWKLALAVHGRASGELLDTYDAERRPAAERVIGNTRAQLALMRPGPEPDALRTVFTELLAAGGGQGRLSGMISAQDTVLPVSAERASTDAGTFLYNAPLHTRTGATDVIGLLRDGRPLLLLLGEQSASREAEARAWEGALHVVRALPTPEVPYDALLVRPDGYLAWTPGTTELSAAVSQYVGRPGAAGGPASEVRPGVAGRPGAEGRPGGEVKPGPGVRPGPGGQPTAPASSCSSAAFSASA
ncbi:FAD-dependent monooxygenase [Streptomyces sp. NPDC059533]|uniref:FAD-dependent monooxygenase n=1 Tax=unclassified Streptomyces TaxID=2593676 RepID=UPI003696B734